MSIDEISSKGKEFVSAQADAKWSYRRVLPSMTATIFRDAILSAVRKSAKLPTSPL
jgi:hypothetical protein